MAKEEKEGKLRKNIGKAGAYGFGASLATALFGAYEGLSNKRMFDVYSRDLSINSNQLPAAEAAIKAARESFSGLSQVSVDISLDNYPVHKEVGTQILSPDSFIKGVLNGSWRGVINLPNDEQLPTGRILGAVAKAHLTFNNGTVITETVTPYPRIFLYNGSWNVMHDYNFIKENVQWYSDHLKPYQASMNFASNLIVASSITAGISLGLMYISDPKGTKQILKDEYQKIKGIPSKIGKKMENFYSDYMRPKS
jgi:hypothetical protein